jgi:hypothetical protein
MTLNLALIMGKIFEMRGGPSLLQLLTRQILNGKISVDEARGIILRRYSKQRYISPVRKTKDSSEERGTKIDAQHGMGKTP